MIFDSDILLTPPSGGYKKLALLGVVLPLVLIYFGIHAWITEEATVYYKYSYGSIVERGTVAKAFGMACTGVGTLAHFRWFWGLLSLRRMFEFGTLLSLLAIAGGLFWVCWQTFFAWI